MNEMSGKRRPGAGLSSHLPVVLMLASCASPAQREVELSPTMPGTYVFTCDGDYRFSARVADDSVHLRLDDENISLPQVPAASGTRYSAGGVTFWSRRAEARLETPEGVRAACSGLVAETPWKLARLLGNDFRAVGQEPGWVVEIDEDRRIHVVADYGEVELHTTPPLTERRADGTVVHSARAEEQVVTVTITDQPCQDTMSGEAFPKTVTLTVNGGEYQGCGRPLDGTGETMLTAFPWTLTEIEGAPAAIEGLRAPELQFDDAAMRVSGFTGCNRLSGSFALEDHRLSFPVPLVMTRMACADPRGGELERKFVEMLARVDRFSTADGTLTLFHEQEPLARFSRP